ncbi:hypothetical protein H2201_008607, partial [Coniosporium apollinis]
FDSNFTFGEVSAGRIVLQGALKWANVLPNPIIRWHEDYLAPSVATGRWTAHIVNALEGIVGFAALDGDPAETDLYGTLLACLLVRNDEEGPKESWLPTGSLGWTRPRSCVPLMATFTSSGHFKFGNQGKRYTACLLLRRVAKGQEVYRRVGLCQIYHSFWNAEIENPEERRRIISIV